MSDNKALIKKIEDLEKQLSELKIELKYPTRNVKKSEKLKVGTEVDILNPKINQGSSGIVTKAFIIFPQKTFSNNFPSTHSGPR